jgi:molecular chaperone GrpE
VKAESPAKEKPDLAAMLKDAEARLTEAEKRIRQPARPHPGPAAAGNAEVRHVETETRTARPTEPHVGPVAAKETEARPAEAEKQTEPPAEPGADLAAALRDTEARLAEAEKHAAEQHDACLRARAETENVRRRAQEDIAKASKFAAEKLAGAMLPVKDSLEAALATDGQTSEKLREGVELTLRQIATAFEGANLAEENPIGQKFDPNKHEAIGVVESEAEPNTVIKVLQKGYLLHGRVIRPAMVMVSRAKSLET